MTGHIGGFSTLGRPASHRPYRAIVPCWGKHRIHTLCIVLALALASASLNGCGNNVPNEQVQQKNIAPEEPEKTPRQLYLTLSHTQATLKTVHDQHFLNYFRLESQSPQLPPELVPEVRAHIIENVTHTRLMDQFISEFTKRVTDDDLQFMNYWLATDLGKKVTELEMHQFLRPDVTIRKVNYLDLSPTRQKLLAQYVEYNKLTHLTITVLKLTKLAILEGVSSVTGVTAQQPNTSVSEHERSMLYRQILNQYAGLFASLTDAELAQANEVSQKPIYQKVHLARHRALIVTFSSTAQGIGKILGEGSRYFATQAPSTPPPQTQQQTDETTQGKPKPPDVGRGRIMTYPIKDENLGY